MAAFGTLNSNYVLDGVRLGDRLTTDVIGPTTKVLGTISSTSTGAPHVPNTNRIADAATVTTYGGTVALGDLVVESPNTFTWANGYVVSYFFAATEWDDLTGEPTIWFNGDTLCPGGRILEQIKFQNTSDFDSPWTIDKATFKNIPGTDVLCQNITCHGLLDWVLAGTGTLSPWPVERVFLTGSFGFHIIQPLTVSSHGIAASVRNGGTMDLSGFESQHGFSAVRLMPEQTLNIVESLIIHDFYLHDTDSEGFYIGMTTAPPLPVFRNVQIYQGFIARTGTEPIQLQNFNGSDVHHITVYAADIAWKHPFQNFQSTALQLVYNGGINDIRDIIVNGYGINGLMLYSVVVADGNIFFSEVDNTSTALRIAYFQGRSSGSYTNNIAAGNGIDWRIIDCAWSHFNDTWADYTGEANVQYIITKGNLMTDIMTVEGLIHDGSKPVVIEIPGDWNVSGTILDPSRPLPVHVNDGFDNHPERISQWHQFYAKWFPISNNIDNSAPTHWYVDEIAMWINPATERWEWYKTTTDHFSTADTPNISPNFGPKLTWDEAGIRSDMGGWTSGDTQSDYPPDDLRLEPGDPYTLLGAQFTTTTTSTTT